MRRRCGAAISAFRRSIYVESAFQSRRIFRRNSRTIFGRRSVRAILKHWMRLRSKPSGSRSCRASILWILADDWADSWRMTMDISRRALVLMLLGVDDQEGISGITRLQKLLFILEQEEKVTADKDGFGF